MRRLTGFRLCNVLKQLEFTGPEDCVDVDCVKHTVLFWHLPLLQDKDSKRDPQMHQTKKGNQYYFGAKAHIGVEKRKEHPGRQVI